MSTDQKPEGATSILVLGLLSLIMCMCPPLGVIAWIRGNHYLADCCRAGVKPYSRAVAGRILGMLASVLLLVGLAIGMLVLCVELYSGAFAWPLFARQWLIIFALVVLGGSATLFAWLASRRAR